MAFQNGFDHFGFGRRARIQTQDLHMNHPRPGEKLAEIIKDTSNSSAHAKHAIECINRDYPKEAMNIIIKAAMQEAQQSEDIDLHHWWIIAAVITSHTYRTELKLPRYQDRAPGVGRAIIQKIETDMNTMITSTAVYNNDLRVFVPMMRSFLQIL